MMNRPYAYSYPKIVILAALAVAVATPQTPARKLIAPWAMDPMCREAGRTAVLENTGKIQVRISASRAAYLQGEQIAVTARLRNPTNEVLQVFDPTGKLFDVFGESKKEVGGWHSLIMHSRDGNGWWQPCNAPTWWLNPGEERENVVRTGELTSGKISPLEALGSERPPGRYKIKFDYYQHYPETEISISGHELVEFARRDWPASSVAQRAYAEKWNERISTVAGYVAIILSDDRYYAVASAFTGPLAYRSGRAAGPFIRLAESESPLSGLEIGGDSDTDYTVSWRGDIGVSTMRVWTDGQRRWTDIVARPGRQLKIEFRSEDDLRGTSKVGDKVVAERGQTGRLLGQIKPIAGQGTGTFPAVSGVLPAPPLAPATDTVFVNYQEMRIMDWSPRDTMNNLAFPTQPLPRSSYPRPSGSKPDA